MMVSLRRDSYVINWDLLLVNFASTSHLLSKNTSRSTSTCSGHAPASLPAEIIQQRQQRRALAAHRKVTRNEHLLNISAHHVPITHELSGTLSAGVHCTDSSAKFLCHGTVHCVPTEVLMAQHRSPSGSSVWIYECGRRRAALCYCPTIDAASWL